MAKSQPAAGRGPRATGRPRRQLVDVGAASTSGRDRARARADACSQPGVLRAWLPGSAVALTNTEGPAGPLQGALGMSG